MPSKRIQQINPSAIREVFDLASKLENPCDLSIGQPHFDTPEKAKEAAIAAVRAGKNGYTPTQGIAPLREAVLASYAERGVPQEDCFITSAVSGGFMLALIATCDVGDELIIPDPYFVMWNDLAKTMGVTPKLVNTYPDFKWRRERLEAQITPKTRAISLCSPANPTGASVEVEELKMIAEVARKHDLWIIYDEVYRLFTYDGPHFEMSKFYPKTITLGGFSKSHSMTGWRIGTAVGPKEIIQPMIRLQQYTFICAPTPGQWGALAAIEMPMTEEVEDYRQKRDFMYNVLKDHYEVAKPSGSFYLFVKALDGMSGDDFVKEAIKRNLILVPGSAFSEQNTHFRLSFANSDEQLKRGAKILVEMARERELALA